jgi:carbonic anhydrase
MRTLDKDAQQALTPQCALDILREGNKRFINNLKANRNLLEQANETVEGQYPFVIVLSCIDSRTSVELIFDQGLGDVFSVRVAGNVINDDILGSMEFACKLAGSKLIVVLGHSHCGAVKGACGNAKLEHLTGLLDKIKPAMESAKDNSGDLSYDDFVQKVADANVQVAVDQIMEKSKTLKKMIENGEIGIVGGMHDIKSGQVEFFSGIGAE